MGYLGHCRLYSSWEGKMSITSSLDGSERNSEMIEYQATLIQRVR